MAKKQKTVKQEKLTDICPVRKKGDRFNGLTEDEVLAKTLPDHLAYDLDIIIIGINPGLTAAHVGHHYAGPGNHFWKCLYLSGLTAEQMNAYDDYKLKDIGIGFTNIVERTSRSSADLTRTEIKQGAEALVQKIKRYRPKIAVFNGKGIYEVFCGHKNFFIGKQPEPFPDTSTVVFVMPSSSARCSQLPRAVDKLPFYVALCKLRDHLRGDLPSLDDTEVTFPDLELKVEPKKERLDSEVKQEIPDPEMNSHLIANQLASGWVLQLKVEIKTEDGELSGKRKRGRRKRSLTAGKHGKDIPAPSSVGSVSQTVCSPYFPPWQPPLLCTADLVSSGNCTSVGAAADMTLQVKQETSSDFALYGQMPDYWSNVRTCGNLLPLPDVKPTFCWPPTNL